MPGPPPQTLPELIARGWPPGETSPFLSVPAGPTITYGDAWRAAARIAHALRRLGVQRGDRVAVQALKSPGLVLLYLACIRSGAVLLPMNTGYTESEVAFLVADATPRLFVHDDGGGPGGPMSVTVDALVALAREEAEDFDDVAVEPEHLAALLYTSGTTGKPKGAMLTHANLATNSAALHEIWGFEPSDVLLHALPLFHTHGLFVAINTVLANGTGMIFLSSFSTDAVLSQLPSATVFMGVPTFYSRLLADDRLTSDVCAGMRLFVSGSAPLLASTHDEFEARTGHRILERYGMTETSMITSNPLHGERKAGTVGFPLPDVEVRVTEPATGEVVAAGTIGGIEVRGPNVCAGYWGRAEQWATELTGDGFFRTGDMGTFDDEGYLQIVGRSKDLIISGGLNVYPKEVEEVLDELDGVAESAVIGVPDADFGEAVVAVVVPRSGHTVDGEDLRARARERLAAFKVPKRVVVVQDLPRNTMGKVEKARLRETYGA